MKGIQKNAKGTVNLNKTERTVIIDKILQELEDINQRVETLEKIYTAQLQISQNHLNQNFLSPTSL